MTGTPFLRRCIRIRAEDSPNVRLALLQLALGQAPTDERVVPGVLSWAEYQERRRTLPKARQSVVLDAQWWEGADERLVLPEWADAARLFARGLDQPGVTLAEGSRTARHSLPRYMGVDPAAGGDDSAWVAGDRLGVTHCHARKTPNTNDVVGLTLEYMRAWNVPAGNVVFDLGGGGREHADRLRAMGHPVRGVGFGKAPSLEVKRAGVLRPFEERRSVTEDAAAYQDRRSEMAWDIRLILERDAAGAYQAGKFHPGSLAEVPGFGLAGEHVDELVRQLLAPPVRWDEKGRFKLIPKDDPKLPAHEQDRANVTTFRKLIGRSPDLFDAMCCMVFGMTHRSVPNHAGAM